jgi:signal transduction histidine kinase
MEWWNFLLLRATRWNMTHRRLPDQLDAAENFREQIPSHEFVPGTNDLHEPLQPLITAQERKLANIARELHDDICQRLALLSLRIEKVAKGWANGQMQIGEQLQQIWQQCSDLTRDVQALSHELHPSVLDNLGLVSALQSLCREVTEQTDIRVEFTSRNIPSSLPREVSLSLFRLVQEALHNSVKYSRGNHSRVRLEGGPGRIELEVCDRGAGFDLACVRNKGGLGLLNMRERIHMLNGTITIDAKPNFGTTIRACVPLAIESRAFAAAN